MQSKTGHKASKLTKENIQERVIIDENGCWIWQGARKNPGISLGYGSVFFNGANMNAHRASWWVHYGPVPSGVHVCHKCDVALCVNPAHLFLGTQSDNMRDMWAKKRHPKSKPGQSSKLSQSEVAKIRELLGQKTRQKIIAAQFGISQSTVSLISTGKHWGEHA